MTRTAIFAILALITLFFVSTPAMAQDTRASVESRIKDRFPKLEKYRDDGKVGEVFDGTIQYVNDANSSDGNLKTLVDQENADRKILFAIIVKEEGGTVEKVAQVYARKLFDLAKSNHYLKGKNGKWVKKSEVMGR
jgi:uncharacterized protein